MKKNLIIYMVLLVICLISTIIIITKVKEKNENTELEKIQEGGSKYSEEQLNNFEFKITNMDSSIQNKINNYEMFSSKMKEYIYLNGLVEADNAKYLNCSMDEKNNKIILIFKLNDKNNTTLIANILLNDDNYAFSHY